MWKFLSFTFCVFSIDVFVLYFHINIVVLWCNKWIFDVRVNSACEFYPLFFFLPCIISMWSTDEDSNRCAVKDRKWKCVLHETISILNDWNFRSYFTTTPTQWFLRSRKERVWSLKIAGIFFFISSIILFVSFCCHHWVSVKRL
jgi:hypothetical protein